jgi:hypothetical protein
VCIFTSRHKNEQFLKQGINIKFCVKLGINVSVTCAMRFEAYVGEAMKKSCFWIA